MGAVKNGTYANKVHLTTISRKSVVAEVYDSRKTPNVVTVSLVCPPSNRCSACNPRGEER